MSQFAFATSFAPAEDETVEALKKARIASWQRFLELGLPDSRHENFQYIRLQKMLESAYNKAEMASVDKGQLAIYDECRSSHLVFVNGYLRLDLSDVSALPKGSFVLPLGQAMRSYSALLTTRLNKLLKDEDDPFALLNIAHHQEGGFIYIAPKQTMERPIQILSVITAKQEHAWMMPRLQVFVGKSAVASFVNTTQYLSGTDGFCNSAIDLEIDENAKVSLAHIDLSNAPEGYYNFISYRAKLMRESQLEAVQVTDSAKSRRDWSIVLAGESAEANVSGLWYLNKNKETHTNVAIEHQEPHTRSMQLFKGVLDDQALSSFQGKIKVCKKAQKTSAYQLNNNLLLSDEVQANSKPNLEIFADDVKASHGATFGQLDEEQLFYLKTRGLSHSQARSILIRGFCEEVLAKLPLESLKQLALRHLATLEK